MAKVKFNAPGVSFECEGEEKLVENSFKAFADEFSSKVKEKIASAEAAEEKDETMIDEYLYSMSSEEYPFEDVKMPEERILANRCTHTYTDSWKNIVAAIKRGLKLCYGDSIITKLNDGRECELVCIEETDDAYRLESRDCMGGETSADNLDSYLQNIYDNLPDAMTGAIKPVKRKYRNADGAEYEKEKMVFVPAQTEIFSEEECYGDDGLYEQLEWYKDPHNRVRSAIRGEQNAWWYWCSSPYAGDATSFCYVTGNGETGNATGDTAHGLAPFGCYIRKS